MQTVMRALTPNGLQYNRGEEQRPTKQAEVKMFDFPDFDNFMHPETEGSDKWVQLRDSTCHLLKIV